MNSENRDPFDMPPFEPPAFYQRPNSRVDCYSEELWLDIIFANQYYVVGGGEAREGGAAINFPY